MRFIDMTIERTRQIFGKKMESWNDEQVLTFIQNMSIVGDALLQTAITELTNKNKNANT